MAVAQIVRSWYTYLPRRAVTVLCKCGLLRASDSTCRSGSTCLSKTNDSRHRQLASLSLGENEHEWKPTWTYRTLNLLNHLFKQLISTASFSVSAIWGMLIIINFNLVLLGVYASCHVFFWVISTKMHFKRLWMFKMYSKPLVISSVSRSLCQTKISECFMRYGHNIILIIPTCMPTRRT